jgi:hypothetical protein
MPFLRPCSGCNRHVRSEEARCPFCDAEIAAVLRPSPVPSGRIGRAALMAFGAALATASIAGCKGEEPAIEPEESAKTARPDTETRTTPAEENRGRQQGSAAKDDTAPMKSPFLVGSEPPSTAPTNQEPARVVPTVKPPPPVTATPIKQWNHAKPYGAPPADGIVDVV